jgi:histone H3/H4
MPKTMKKTPVKKKTKTTESGSFDLPIAPVVRIAKRNGAERISMSGTRAILSRTERYIADVARKAANAAASEGRKTIKAEDVDRF